MSTLTRANLVKLGEEVRKAEYRFYRRYNELNTKRDYAIDCFEQSRPNSRFRDKLCRPVFQTKAEEEESRAFFMDLTRQYSAGSVSAATAVAAGKPAYQQNIREVTGRNPDLIKLLQEHGKLLKEYQAMYLKVFPTQPQLNAAPVPSADAK